jgi:glutathione S-transferase
MSGAASGAKSKRRKPFQICMEADMKLYQSNASPNSRRVRIYMAEKGISMPIVPVDLGAREQFSDAYAAINPRRVIPTLLLDDGTAIGEVPAIQRYLDEIHPEPPLSGTTPESRALVSMWDRRAEQEGFASVMEAVRNAVPGLKNRAIAGPHDYEQIPALVERSRQRVKNFYADFNARLAEVAFVAGRSVLGRRHYRCRHRRLRDQGGRPADPRRAHGIEALV